MQIIKDCQEMYQGGMVTRYRQNGLLFLVLENAYLRTTIIPSIGGKMIELMKKDTGTQFLLQASHEYSRARLPYYGANYFQYSPSGFNECFPTIAASAYPKHEDCGQQSHIQLPDHGELWSIPWEYHVSEESIYLSVRGVRVNYEFNKTIRAEKAAVHIDYRLINLSSMPLLYMWSAQPFLGILSNSEITIEQGVDKVLLDRTTDPNIGQHGEYVPWPKITGSQDANYAIIPEHPKKHTVKLYTDKLIEGICGYRRSDTGEKLTLEFDPRKIPYLGILLWYNEESNKSELFSNSSVALQPSAGRPDSLQQAYQRKEHSELDSFDMKEWSLRISLS